ncbi:MAG: hypothetical protein ACO280_04270 [Pseudohongiellaceae bacterium]
MTMPAQDSLAEQLRRYYLQQLGIMLYLPREMASHGSTDVGSPQLPPAVPASDEEALGIPAAEQPSSAAVLVASPPRASLVSTRVAAPDESTLPAGSGAAAEQSPPIAFQCLFAHVAPGLALLLQLPSAGNGLLSAGEQRLLANILHWLGWGVSEAQDWRPYRWPLPGLPMTTAEAGRRGLSAFLDQAIREQPLQHLLVFGSLPLQQEHCGWQLWTLPGLGEMLKVAGLKRETWQRLLPLRAGSPSAAR